MSKAISLIKIIHENPGGLIKTTEGDLPFVSKIYTNNQWHLVPFLGQKSISHLPLEIKWIRENIDPGWVALQAELTNKGREPVRLGSFHMMEGGNLGTAVSDPVVFLDAGFRFAGAVKGKASCPPYMEKWENYFIANEDICWAKDLMGGTLAAGAHYSPAGLMVYYRGQELPSWMLSFIVPMARCSAAPVLLIDPRTGGVRAFALVNNFAGYELLPGETIATETILMGMFGDPHEALETWAGTCAKIRKLTVYPKPPVGWLSWYGYWLTQNETDTMRTIDLIKREFDGLGFEYMQLDLGYNKGDLPGDWFEVNERYPRGLKYLADEFSKRGFKLGVWVSPTVLAAECEFAREHPEALIPVHPKDPRKWYFNPHPEIFELDPTHPEGEKFLRRIVRHFKAMGVRYFKFDFMSRMGRVDPDFLPYDKRKVKGVEVYRHAQKIIMEELARDDYVYWCSNLIHYGIGMGSTSMATSDDIGDTEYSSKKGRKEFSRHFGRQATTTISRYYLHEKMLRLNPDSLNLAPPADLEECRMRATLVAMSGGQMFLGDRFDLGKKDRFEIIRQVTPPYGHVARPVDLFERVYPDAYPRIWHLAVNTGWDRRDLVALMNCEHDMTMEVDLKRLKLFPDKEYYLWEFWEQKYLGRIKDKFSMRLRYPSSRLMALVPVRDYPWVLSTSFHVSQGGCDLAGVKWNEKTAVLSGVLCRPKGITGNIFITAPSFYSCALKKIAQDVYCLPISVKAARTRWSVKFKKIEG